jgi:cell division topological specificity factor
MILNLFRRSPKAGSATSAKDRLQILLAHERAGNGSPDLLLELQADILAVIERRMKISRDRIDIQLGQSDDLSTVEINIELNKALG